LVRILNQLALARRPMTVGEIVAGVDVGPVDRYQLTQQSLM
jgi:hypothetical protein